MVTVIGIAMDLYTHINDKTNKKSVYPLWVQFTLAIVLLDLTYLTSLANDSKKCKDYFMIILILIGDVI